MSRVANNPVSIPAEVDIRIDGQTVYAKGKLGELQMQLHQNVELKQGEGKLHIVARDNSKRTKCLSGTMRALLANMVSGVSQGFSKKIELRGVGYRAQMQGNNLQLSLGYSHPVVYKLPESVRADVVNQTEVSIKGIDKQKVGQVAAQIRMARPPEPYKGKGVRYANENIIRKEVKKK